MKKFLMLLILAITFPIAAFCQSVEIDTSNLFGYFTDFGPAAALVIFIVEFFKNKLKVKGGLLVLFSWLVSIVLAFVGWLLKLGMFAEISWFYALIYGVGIALVANLIADVPTVKSLLALIPQILKIKKE